MTKLNIIRKEGGSRVIAVSSVIPLSWIAVEMKVIKGNNKVIVVQFSKVK